MFQQEEKPCVGRLVARLGFGLVLGTPLGGVPVCPHALSHACTFHGLGSLGDPRLCKAGELS